MNKKKFTLIESSLTGMDNAYSYENYVEYCHETEQEPDSKDSSGYWDWVHDMSELDYDDFFENLKYSKEEKENGHYMITADLGRWNGRRIGYKDKIFNSISEAIKDALSCSDYWDYKIEFDNGVVVVYGYHHDGTDIMYVRKLSKHGERNLCDKYFPDFEKYIDKKDTFKKLDWQFAWN